MKNCDEDEDSDNENADEDERWQSDDAMVALELAVRRMKKNYDPADEDNVEEDADEKSDGRVMIQGQPPTNPPTALIVTLAHHHLTPRTIHLHPRYTLTPPTYTPHYTLTPPILYTYITQTIH